MTPDYALSLSFSGIALLQRASAAGGPENGWYKLGEVALDVDDLGGALAVLREEAVPGADVDGPEVKLILPNEQIKFLSFAYDGDAPMQAAEDAVVAATPYTADEIVFDWRANDGTVQVAAVARETLTEAESFARDHKFLPMGFVAVPPSGAFDGEPFFGPTSDALTHLAPGVTVMGDVDAVDVIAGAPVRGDTIAVETLPEIETPPAEPVPEPVSEPASAPEVAATPEQSATPAPEPEPAAAPVAETTQKPAPVEPPQPASEAPITAQPTTPPAPAKSAWAPKPDAPAAPDATPASPSLPSPAAMSDAAPSVAAPGSTPEAPKVAFASLRADRGAAPATAAPASAPNPNAMGKTPPLSAAQPDAPAAKAPISPASAGVTEPVAPERETPKAGPTFAAAIKARALESLAARGEPLADDASAPQAAPPAGTPAQQASGDGMAASAGAIARDGAASVTNVIARAGSGLGRGIGFVSRRTGEIRAARAERSAAAAAAAPVSDPKPTGGAAAALTAGNKMDEAERMTVFGARRSAKNNVGGKPRFLGLILTAALLLFLLGVAAFAAVFVDDGLARLFGGPDEETPTETALSTPAPGDAQDEATAATTPNLSLPTNGETSETGIDVASLTPGLPADTAALLAEPDLDGLARAIGAEALSPEEAEARYAATGIWQRAPTPPADLRQGVLDDLYIASIDRDVTQQDAIALPDPRSLVLDVALRDPGLPPSADERFAFDARGLIKPTVEGVTTPQGYTLIKGRPGILPPVRASLATPEAPSDEGALDTPIETETETAETANEEAEPTDAAPAGPLVVDSTLFGIRPNARPDDLKETTERATLGGVTLEEFAALRPNARPRAVERAAAAALARAAEAEAEAERLSAEAEKAEADAAARAEAEAAARKAEEEKAAAQQKLAKPAEEAQPEKPAALPLPKSRLALVTSGTPKTRPRNMANIVRRTERQQAREATRVAAVAPRTVKPAAPSSNAVARAATQSNAINLRRVNLIGVYGKPSSRRALVRLSNGRFKKVKVGDRIDGGRILAISDSQLRYQKGGRSVTLNIPQS